MLRPVGSDNELRFIAHENASNASQLGNRVQMSLRRWIENVYGIIDRIGDVNVATRCVHGHVVEAPDAECSDRAT